MPGWLYEAQAACKDGAGIVGLEYPGTAGTKSYAYCSDYNSSVQTGYGAFSRHNIIIGG
jgi:methylaspartate ammonia-lyase